MGAVVTTHRLRSAADIRRTVSVRNVAGGDSVVIHARVRADGGPGRVAVVAGRRVGSAVRRNRAKRRIREAVRRAEVPAGFDLVLSAKAGADEVAFPDLVTEVQHAMRRSLSRARSRAAVAR